MGVRLLSQTDENRVRTHITWEVEPAAGDILTAGLAATMGKAPEQRPSVVVVGNKAPVGRDLSNRRLAHIVTGGLSDS